MRWHLVLAIVLIVAACGDDEGASRPDDPAGSAIETTTSDPDSAPVTTGATTTTRAAKPWTTLPAPDPVSPSLQPGYGALGGVESFCIEVGSPGVDDSPGGPIGGALRALGYALGGPECATLRIVVDESRLGSTYSAFDDAGTTCWNGFEAVGTVDLLVGSDTIGTWPVEAREPPPASIDECRGEFEPVDDAAWFPETLLPAVFGDHGRVAGEAWLEDGVDLETNADLLEGTAMAEVLAPMLYAGGEDMERAVDAVMILQTPWRLAGNPEPAPPSLVDLVPYLLATGNDDALLLVEGITGAEGPRSAWEWYLSRRG